MKKYLIPSTLISAVALATPAWAGELVFDKGGEQDMMGDVSFTSGSSLIVKNGTTCTMTGFGNRLFSGDTLVSVTEASSLIMTGKTTLNDEDGVGPTVVIAGGSSLVTSDAMIFNGGTISIDETSTWTSSGDVTFGATAELAITTTADSSTASVQLGEVYFYKGASVSITVDLSDVDVDEGVSLVLFEATSIIFDYNGTTGTTLTADNINTFMENYVTFTGGVVAEEWSYDATTGIISASVTYLPEPSMFGLMFGLGTIGLVATRRRKRA